VPIGADFKHVTTYLANVFSIFCTKTLRIVNDLSILVVV